MSKTPSDRLFGGSSLRYPGSEQRHTQNLHRSKTYFEALRALNRFGKIGHSRVYPMEDSSVPSVLQKLKEFASTQPDKLAWSFLNDKGDVIDSYTYAELENASNHLAHYLITDAKLNAGDRVLLVFFPSLTFTVTLLACFKCGLIAVPVFPPDPRRQKKDIHHFISIQRSSEAAVALTHSEYNFAKRVSDLRNMFSSSAEQWPTLRWICIDNHLQRTPCSATLPASSTTIAFLQYTSGSTSDPKGVMISHFNLSHNQSIIAEELKTTTSTVCVSWLPQYHDMGLIGSYLGTLYCGGSGYYLSPLSFLKDPPVWVRCMSRYKATHSQAPSFAFALTARKFTPPTNNADLDLSSLQHIINAAEPIDPAAMQSFYDVFQPFGLSPVIIPTYGLAEHTVFVCSGGKTTLCVDKAALESGDVVVANEGQVVVGCGFPAARGVEVVIVHPETLETLPDDKVGEIYVNSPSKALGYWNLPELTQRDFHATLPSTSTTYLKTGDLGFLHNGELFICGRLKDLIIIRGTNHYPQDIERSGESVSDIRGGCSAAFALDDENVVYIAEVKEGTSPKLYPSIMQSIRSLISQHHGITLQHLLLLQPRTIPKTTSGKIARLWCKKAFLESKLQVVGSSSSSGDGKEVRSDDDMAVMEIGQDEILGDETSIFAALTAETMRNMTIESIEKLLESALCQLAPDGMLRPPVDKNTALYALGLDSMTMGQFQGVLINRFHTSIPDKFLFTDLATIHCLASVVQRGELSSELMKAMDEHETVPGVEIVDTQNQPFCPWFTCCR